MSNPSVPACGVEKECVAAAAAIWVAVVGVIAYMFMPLVVGSLAEQYSYNNSQLGYVAAAEALGMCAANVVAAFRVRHWRWRPVLFAGMTAMVTANGLSAKTDELLAVVSLRLVDGFAGGLLIAIGLAALSDCRLAGRLFAYLVATEMTLSTVGFLVLPGLIARSGPHALFLVFAALSATLVMAIPFHARSGVERLKKSKSGSRVSVGMAVLAMGGALLFFSAQGGIWAFVERIGTAAAVSRDAIGNALAWSSLLGIAGALGATWTVRAISLRGGLACVAIGELASIVLLVASGGAAFYTVAVGTFVLLWSLSLPLMLVQLNDADGSGALVVMLYAVGKLGYAMGPALMGHIAENTGMEAALSCGAVLLVMGIAAFFFLKTESEGVKADER